MPKKKTVRKSQAVGPSKPNNYEEVRLTFTAAVISGLIAKDGLERTLMGKGPSALSLESQHYRKAEKAGRNFAKLYTESKQNES